MSSPSGILHSKSTHKLPPPPTPGLSTNTNIRTQNENIIPRIHRQKNSAKFHIGWGLRMSRRQYNQRGKVWLGRDLHGGGVGWRDPCGRRPSPLPSEVSETGGRGSSLQPTVACVPLLHLSRHLLTGVEGGPIGEGRGRETGERAGGSQLSPGPDHPHPPALRGVRASIAFPLGRGPGRVMHSSA